VVCNNLNLEVSLQVLIVEDHDSLRQMMAEHLRGCGFVVREADCLVALNRALLQAVPHLLLLDLNLPDADGLVIARQLREAHPAMGIVVITGRDRGTDRAAAYAHGVDVFLKKPFDLAELVALVQSLGRRVLATAAALHAPLVLDAGRGVLRVAGGQAIELSVAEARLLQVLALAPSEGLSLDLIVESMQQQDRADVTDYGLLRLQVHRLRSKLTKQPQTAALLQSVRSVGYRLSERVQVNGL
jgi:two-component system phosphate regulon response regulator OmpR